jgi:hypothetical protein
MTTDPAEYTYKAMENAFWLGQLSGHLPVDVPDSTDITRVAIGLARAFDDFDFEDWAMDYYTALDVWGTVAFLRLFPDPTHKAEVQSFLSDVEVWTRAPYSFPLDACREAADRAMGLIK